MTDIVLLNLSGNNKKLTTIIKSQYYSEHIAMI